MSLLTSVVDLEGVKSQYSKTSQQEKVNESFQSVLKGKYQSGTESMDSIFEEASARYGVSVDLIKSVAKAESNFNTKAVSKAGAVGVMQLMPATARSLGVTDPYDARQNIMGGTKYLKENLDRFGGNVSLALAAYNAGPNSVQKYGGIPPYKETQNYVKTVLSYMNGSPLSSGKMVSTGSSQYSQLAGLYGTGTYGSSGLTSNSLLGLYGSGYGSSSDILSALVSSAATADEGGDTISLSKESFSSLIEILRLQMMMNASREIGNISV